MPEDVKTKEDWVKFSEKFAVELGDLKAFDSYTEIRSFLKKWNGLRAIDQQQLCGGFLFRPPLMPLIALMNNSYMINCTCAVHNKGFVGANKQTMN